MATLRCQNPGCDSPLDQDGICPLCNWDGMPSKFELGLKVSTRGVADLMTEDPAFASFVYRSMARHSRGDWGDLCKDDKRENELSLKKCFRLLSAYEKPPHPKIWIITEADRSATTILFPSEY